MKKREPIESIALSLKVLLWIVGVPAVLFSGLVVWMVWDVFGDMGEPRYTVVVAKTNLVAGAVLTTNNLASDELTCSELQTNDYVRRRNANILLGHQVLSAVERGELIEWRNTDIVITNRVSR